MNFNPIYFNREYAKSMGYRDVVVNHMLVMNVVFGLSVEDLSERRSRISATKKRSTSRPFIRVTRSPRNPRCSPSAIPRGPIAV